MSDEPVKEPGPPAKTVVHRCSTIGASYPAGGGVFLDCLHCGQTLLLSGRRTADSKPCPGTAIKEIEALFRKAHTHEK